MTLGVTTILMAALCLTSRKAVACKSLCSCVCNAGVADCSNMQLKELPRIFKNTTYLILSGNSLSGLTEADLDPGLNYTTANITKIDMDHNGLYVLQPNAFQMTPALKEVNFDYNNFSSFPGHGLPVLSNTLQKISIKYNQLRNVDKVIKITSLDIRGNCLTGFDWVKNTPDLQVLLVGGQPNSCILDFHEEFLSRLPDLRRLQFSGTLDRSAVFNSSVWEVPSRLSNLELSTSTVGGISFNNSNLQSLKLHRIRGNPKLSGILRLCETLQYLHMKHTVVYPNYFSAPSNGCVIQVMYIANSSMLYVNMWDKLPRLRKLIITKTALKTLAPQGNEKPLSSLVNVEELRLHSNAISSLSPTDFSSYNILKTLDLSSNNLQNFGVTSIGKISSLIYLDLSQNQISHLDGKIQLGALEYLGLSGNKISHIPKDFFSLCRSLKVVDLSYNLFTTLGSFTVLAISGLVILGDENPWQCDSNMTKSYNIILSKGNVDLVCGYKKNDDGKMVSRGLTNDKLYAEFQNSGQLCMICKTPEKFTGLKAETFNQLRIQTSTETTDNIKTSQVTTTAKLEKPLLFWVALIPSVLLLVSLAVLIGFCCKKRGRRSASSNQNAVLPPYVHNVDDVVKKHSVDHTYESVKLPNNGRTTNYIRNDQPAEKSAFSRLQLSKFRKRILNNESTAPSSQNIRLARESAFSRLMSSRFRKKIAKEGKYEIPISQLDRTESHSTEVEVHEIDGYLAFSTTTTTKPDLSPSALESPAPSNIGRNMPMTSSLYLQPIAYSSRVPQSSMSPAVEENKESDYENVGFEQDPPC